MSHAGVPASRRGSRRALLASTVRRFGLHCAQPGLDGTVTHVPAENLGSEPDAVSRRPLVGREVELARILSALEATIAGGGRFVLVAGEDVPVLDDQPSVSKRKISIPAYSSSPGQVWWQWSTTRSPSAIARLNSTCLPGYWAAIRSK